MTDDPAVPPEDMTGTHWADLDEFGCIRDTNANVEDRRLQFVVGARENRSDAASDIVLCSEN